TGRRRFSPTTPCPATRPASTTRACRCTTPRASGRCCSPSRRAPARGTPRSSSSPTCGSTHCGRRSVRSWCSRAEVSHADGAERSPHRGPSIRKGAGAASQGGPGHQYGEQDRPGGTDGRAVGLDADGEQQQAEDAGGAVLPLHELFEGDDEDGGEESENMHGDPRWRKCSPTLPSWLPTLWRLSPLGGYP